MGNVPSLPDAGAINFGCCDSVEKIDAFVHKNNEPKKALDDKLVGEAVDLIRAGWNREMFQEGTKDAEHAAVFIVSMDDLSRNSVISKLDAAEREKLVQTLNSIFFPIRTNPLSKDRALKRFGLSSRQEARVSRLVDDPIELVRLVGSAAQSSSACAFRSGAKPTGWRKLYHPAQLSHSLSGSTPSRRGSRSSLAASERSISPTGRSSEADALSAAPRGRYGSLATGTEGGREEEGRGQSVAGLQDPALQPLPVNFGNQRPPLSSPTSSPQIEAESGSQAAAGCGKAGGPVELGSDALLGVSLAEQAPAGPTAGVEAPVSVRVHRKRASVSYMYL